MPAIREARRDETREIDYPGVTLISAAHLTNDLYGNLMTSITPYLVIQGDISTVAAGLVLLLYLAGSSLLQPIFGLMSDRTGYRSFAVFGPLVIGLAASAFGWAPSSLTLLALAFCGGIGTAAFHPQAASMVHALSRTRKGWSMAIFSMGGNVGFALGPLGAAGFALVGLHWTPVAIVPALIITAVLLRRAPKPTSSGEEFDARVLGSAVKHAWRPLALIVGVIAARSATQYALIIFLPLYYHARGFAPELGSYSAFALSMAGAAGGLLGGGISDRYGRKIVVVVSLVVAAPLLTAALLASGPLVWLLLVASGVFLLASNSVTVVQGQEMLPLNTGVASGITMGLGFGLSGVVATGLTAIAQHTGVEFAIFLVPILPLIAAVMAVFVPSRFSPQLSAPFT